MKENMLLILKAAISTSLMAIISYPGITQENGGRRGSAVGLVTYSATDETPMKAIAALALQSGVPVGIAVGQDQQLLCRSRRSFDIRDRTPGDALTEVSASAGYRVKEEQHVLVLTAPDLASWQRAVLDHRYSSFPSYSRVAMVVLGSRLTGAIRMTLGNVTTFAASTLYSPTDHMLNFSGMDNASTEDIANNIVNLDGKGIWILRSTVNPPTSAADVEAVIYSYRDDANSVRGLTCGP
jgi:hypothetical protein